MGLPSCLLLDTSRFAGPLWSCFLLVSLGRMLNGTSSHTAEDHPSLDAPSGFEDGVNTQGYTAFRDTEIESLLKVIQSAGSCSDKQINLFFACPIFDK
jgi:hypothetical protein